MPIVRIDIEAGKTTAYKRSLLSSVRRAVTTALEVPDERVSLRVIETPPEDIDVHESRSDRFTLIEVAMIAGRDAEKKERLYRSINLELGRAPGIDTHDITVYVVDPPAECFCVGGVMAGDDVVRAGEAAEGTGE